MYKIKGKFFSLIHLKVIHVQLKSVTSQIAAFFTITINTVSFYPYNMLH